MTKLPVIPSAGERRSRRNSPGLAKPMRAFRAVAVAKERAATGITAGIRPTYPRLIPGRRPETGVGEWLAAMVRGLDALDFLERSRDLAAEPVLAAPAHTRHRPC